MSDDKKTNLDEIEDIDLLDMFDNTDDTVEDTTNTNVDPKNTNEITKKDSTPSSKDVFNMFNSNSNTGSGDVTEDLMNWFMGVDKLPSDPLTELLGNSALKAEFGMMYNMIKNFERMKRIQDFQDKAEEVYFNPEEIITLDPEELASRMKFASTILKDTYEMNRRTISSIKKKGEDEELEKLKVLLSSIPNNKLKDMIALLTNN